MIFLCGLAGLVAAPIDRSSLDFWVGDWVVQANGKTDGHDRIEKLLGGSVIVEHWKDVSGENGESFFYYMPRQNRWKQVWVTREAYKEKLSEPFPNGIRFKGVVFLPNGNTFHDRTTLTRLEGGRVRQLIESSRDGTTWRVTYDAEYRRETAPGGRDGAG